MGRFYGTKIRKEEINVKTDAVWKIEDVPKLWKPATEKWLADNPE